MIDVVFEATLEGFRDVARGLLADEVRPERVRFVERGAAQAVLPLGERVVVNRREIRLPRAYVELAEDVACARDEDRWNILYRVAWRHMHGEPELLELPLDPDVQRLRKLARAVRHEVHHLHAFARFRPDGDRMVARIALAHPVLRRAVSFFVRRFGDQPFAIITPEESVHWDGAELSFGPGEPLSHVEAGDVEDLFAAYYGAVFDPARANERLVDQKLPARFRAAMPEVRALPQLLEGARSRVDSMVDLSVDMSRVPASRALPVLREAAAACDGCDIRHHATQVVFGEGPRDARVMLVGEQPGDREDRTGRPFVGPAGQLLDDVLAELQVARDALYVTNAVKHFKWEPRGKQRLHRSPKPNEIVACRPWLEAEIEAIRPATIVALGAVAGRSFFGPGFRLHKARGRVFSTRWCERMIVTHHPAAILRMADESVRSAMKVELASDLRVALEA